MSGCMVYVLVLCGIRARRRTKIYCRDVFVGDFQWKIDGVVSGFALGIYEIFYVDVRHKLVMKSYVYPYCALRLQHFGARDKFTYFSTVHLRRELCCKYFQEYVVKFICNKFFKDVNLLFKLSK